MGLSASVLWFSNGYLRSSGKSSSVFTVELPVSMPGRQLAPRRRGLVHPQQLRDMGAWPLCSKSSKNSSKSSRARAAWPLAKNSARKPRSKYMLKTYLYNDPLFFINLKIYLDLLSSQHPVDTKTCNKNTSIIELVQNPICVLNFSRA